MDDDDDDDEKYGNMKHDDDGDDGTAIEIGYVDFDADVDEGNMIPMLLVISRQNDEECAGHRETKTKCCCENGGDEDYDYEEKMEECFRKAQ
jgi:hypothetical protein